MKKNILSMVFALGFLSANSADLNVTSGQNIEVSADITYDNINIYDGGTLTIKSGTTVTINSTFTITGAGVFNVESTAFLNWSGTGTMNVHGDVNIYGTVSLDGNLNLTAAGDMTVYTGGAFIQTSGTSSNYGSITVQSGASSSFAGDFTNQGTGTMAIDGSATFDSNLHNAGDIDGDGSVQVDGTTTNTGTMFGSSDSSPDCSTACSQASLPVVLKRCWVEHQNGHLVIYWHVLSELNNDYFEIQSSYDGNDFESIAKVYGRGTTSQSMVYEYLLPGHLNARYLRLSQTDYDGTTEILSYVRVGMDKHDTKHLPTLIRSGESLHLSETENNMHWRLFTLSGVLLEKGMTETGRINLSVCPTGVHILQLNGLNYKIYFQQ